MAGSLPTFDGRPPSELIDDPAQDPVNLFSHWLRAAIDTGVPELDAMTLLTVGEDSVPDACVPILRESTPAV